LLKGKKLEKDVTGRERWECRLEYVPDESAVFLVPGLLSKSHEIEHSLGTFFDEESINRIMDAMGDFAKEALPNFELSDKTSEYTKERTIRTWRKNPYMTVRIHPDGPEGQRKVIMTLSYPVPKEKDNLDKVYDLLGF
jgi:hypothetical protein